MKNLVIIGAGGCGRELLQIAKDINKIEMKWNIKGFLDYDNTSLLNKICSISIIGNDESYCISDDDDFVCGIGDSVLREKIINKLSKKGANFVNLIHPTALISETSQIGKAVVVYPYSSISDNTIIGEGTLVNSHTSIGHDTIIGDYCTISSHCDITGRCVVGRGVFFGSTSNVVPYTKIGDKSYICAGSTVIGKIRSSVKIMGNPAKIVNF